MSAAVFVKEKLQHRGGVCMSAHGVCEVSEHIGGEFTYTIPQPQPRDLNIPAC